MATNNDTTLKFRADISQLKQAMQDAKRQISIANSEFKATSATMDDWTKSTDGISAKLKQLDSNLKSQTAILESLEEQYAKTVEEMGEGSVQADKLRVQINNQKATIANTSKQIANFNDELQKVSEAEKKASKEGKTVEEVLEDMGDEAEEAESGFSVLDGALSVFAGNLLTSFVGAVKEGITALASLAEETREYRQDMGMLETAFASSEFSAESATETYKELFSVIGESDTAVEASQQIALLARSEEDLAKWADLAGGVMGRFGDALKPETFYESANETLKLNEATGAYVQLLEGVGYSVDEFNKGLQACVTEEEKQAYMLQVTDSILGDASESYKELNADIIEAQRAQSELADATANIGAVMEPITTEFKLMGANIITSLLPSIEQLGDGFLGLMDGTEGAGEKIGTAISDMIMQGVNMISTMLPGLVEMGLSLVVNLITGILNALPQVVTTIFSLVGTILQTLAEALPQIALALVEAVPQIIDALMTQLPVFIEACISFLMSIVDAIPTVIEAIINALPMIIDSIVNGLISGVSALIEGAVTLLMAIVEAIPEILTALTNALPQIITAIVVGLHSLSSVLIEGAVQLLLGILEAIPVLVTALYDALPDVIMAIIEGLVNAIPLMLETSTSLFMTIVEAIPALLEALFTKVPTINTVILDILKELVPMLWNLLVSLNIKFTEWVASLIVKAWELLPGVIETVTSFFAQLPERIWTWLVAVVSKLIEWRNQLVAKASEISRKFVDTIVNKIKELPGKMLSIGTDLVKGLWNGINNAGEWLKGKISGFVGNVTDWLKGFFGIHSPSKVMADEVGRWLPEGIAVGIDNNAKSVMSSMRNLTANVLGEVQGGFGDGTLSSIGGGVVYNFNQTNNSPKALSRLEIYRQTNNLLNYAGGV